MDKVEGIPVCRRGLTLLQWIVGHCRQLAEVSVGSHDWAIVRLNLSCYGRERSFEESTHPRTVHCEVDLS